MGRKGDGSDPGKVDPLVFFRRVIESMQNVGR
jgi:hypothetical protein